MTWLLSVDPAVPNTWAPPKVQAIWAGRMFQRGQRTSEPKPTADYLLRLDDRNEVHSFPMRSGQTKRLGVEPVDWCSTGLARVSRMQYVPGAGYQYQAGAPWNTTAGPESDLLFHDGTRSLLQARLTGPDDPYAIEQGWGGGRGDIVTLANYWRVEPWMLGRGLQSISGGIHATDGPGGSPWTNMVGEASFRVITRDSQTPGRAPAEGVVEHLEPITEADVGQPWAVVHRFRLNPVDGFLEVWLNKAGTGWRKIVDRPAGFGWGFAEDDPQSKLWYPILANYYCWHRDSKLVAENWDPRWIEREMAYGFSGYSKSKTAAEAMAELDQLWPASTPTTPPIDPPDPALEARVTALERDYASLSAEVGQLRTDVADLASSARVRLEDLGAEVANLRAGWSALADLARGVADGSTD